MNLILFGFKGSGKTHFGKRIAAELGRQFIDTDDKMIELDGKKRSAQEIYAERGEQGFRELEKRAVFSLKGVENTVIALGGGAVLDPESVEFLLKLGEMVYLDAPPDTLKKRIFRDELPAMMKGEGDFLRIYQERRPLYESIPARRIRTGELDEAGVLAALRSILFLEDSPRNLSQ